MTMDQNNTLLVAVITEETSIVATILNLEEPPRQFANTPKGVEQIESCIYKVYRYPQQVKLCIWESTEQGNPSEIMDKVRRGTILKPRFFSFKRINGLVEVGHMAHVNALRVSAQFGYKEVTLEAASRWCSGEVAKTLHSTLRPSP